MKIAIIGLGYVGLPLSIQFARSGVHVVGLDIDPAKVEAINNGRSYIKHIPSQDVAALVSARQFSASTDFSRVKDVEAVIICVPTPLNKNREPDISFITETGKAIAPYLAPTARKSEDRGQRTEDRGQRTEDRGQRSEDRGQRSEDRDQRTEDRDQRSEDRDQRSEVRDQRSEDRGQRSEASGQPLAFSLQPLALPPLPVLRKLVVLESTTYPGTTDEDLREVLEAGSGLKAGIDFHLAFSPEREDPGNPQSKVGDIPKVVGGFTPLCLEKAKALYSQAIKTIVPVSSCRAAEATKLLENTYRSVNIALVNELKAVYAAMGIDIWEVINAAKTKPFGFMPFYPGPGLGGHCIPIDPFYLTWKAREYGQHTRFIELAGEINTAMPQYVVDRVAEALNAQRKAINGSKILVLGLAYKANVDDDRESPSYQLLDLLQKRGATLAYYDPYVPVIRPSREHSHWAGTLSVTWNAETMHSYDAVVIATRHDAVNYQELASWAACIIDTRNAMSGIATRAGQVWKA